LLHDASKKTLPGVFFYFWLKKYALKQEHAVTSGIHMMQLIRRIILFCLLFPAGFTSHSAQIATESCSISSYDEITKIRYIHDGDTLHLKDGRKVRLIGINTPELARDNRPAEPFAIEAQNTLESLFKTDKSIALLYGKDKKDHYGRLLAHAFTGQGQNIQSALLRQGYARAITIPPNTRFADCYLEMERLARCDKAGAWRTTTVRDTKELGSKDTGFQLIRGRLENIKTNSKGIWLDIDDTLTVGIRPPNLPLFDINELNKLINQTIIVRGWLNKRKGSRPWYIRVRHPRSIQPYSAFSCKDK
jgi:endonuclease YncB( thermonuclease family)